MAKAKVEKVAPTSLIDRLKATSVIKHADILEDSMFFEDRDEVLLPIPMLNVAHSGKLMSGMTPGLTLWCGPSKHFKTLFSMIEVKAYMDKYKDAICLFYDSEFGAGKKYFQSLNIDMSRVYHKPFLNLEEFKFDIVQQLDAINRGDHVIIFMDSLGNSASKKEADDALEGNSAVDMQRAKYIKGLFRIITPHLVIKNIFMVAVNHIYMEMGQKYPRAIVSGGSGPYLSADNIFIVGRQQEKDGTELTGYNFVVNVEKSRYVKEKSKINVSVNFEKGIDTWSGLFDEALDAGVIISPKKGYYQKVDIDTGEVYNDLYREKEFDKEYWIELLRNPTFQKFVESKYSLSNEQLISDQEIERAYAD
jgi:hypothetical protein